MNDKNKLLPYFLPIISLVILAADLLTKKAVWSGIEYARPVNVLGNFFRLTFVYNEGITFGMFNKVNKEFMPFVLMILALGALALSSISHQDDNYYLEGLPALGRIAVRLLRAAGWQYHRRMFLFVTPRAKNRSSNFSTSDGDRRWYTFNARSFVVTEASCLRYCFYSSRSQKTKSSKRKTVSVGSINPAIGACNRNYRSFYSHFRFCFSRLSIS